MASFDEVEEIEDGAQSSAEGSGLIRHALGPAQALNLSDSGELSESPKHSKRYDDYSPKVVNSPYKAVESGGHIGQSREFNDDLLEDLDAVSLQSWETESPASPSHSDSVDNEAAAHEASSVLGSGSVETGKPYHQTHEGEAARSPFSAPGPEF